MCHCHLETDCVIPGPGGSLHSLCWGLPRCLHASALCNHTQWSIDEREREREREQFRKARRQTLCCQLFWALLWCNWNPDYIEHWMLPNLKKSKFYRSEFCFIYIYIICLTILSLFAHISKERVKKAKVREK